MFDASVLIQPNVLRQMLLFATPLLLAAQGEILIQRSGILNVAVEGMMALGASVGFLVAFSAGSNWAGILAAGAAAALLGLILAYAAVTLQAPQLTLGLALFIFASGFASLLYRLVIGIQFVPPKITPFSAGGGHWLTSLPLPVYLALGVAVVVYIVLFHTWWGLRLRSAGENPRAADLQGVNVFAIRYISTVVGAAMVGMAGALLPMMLTGTYSEGMVGGRGWIALMLVILGRWQPFGAVVGAWLFGYVEALQFQLGLTFKQVAPQFLLMLPYVFVLVVAIRAYRGASAPAALMVPYDRERRG